MNRMTGWFFVFIVGVGVALAGPAAGEEIAGCKFKGIALKGKVQIVENFADIKVQVVDNFADIKVKKVGVFPDDCGEWQFVENFPDFKIQIVDNFADIKVKWVENFPGIP